MLNPAPDFQSPRHSKNAGTIADLLIDQPKLDVRLKKVKNNPRTALNTIERNGGKKFDLLPAELSLAWVVKNPAQMDYRLEKVLAKIKDPYDYVLSTAHRPTPSSPRWHSLPRII